MLGYMLKAVENHRKICMYEQMNYMKRSTKFLVTGWKRIGKPTRSYYNNSGEKRWGLELNSNGMEACDQMWEIKKEKITVTDMLRGREKGWIKGDFQVASVGRWLK